jgi:hypothetical protein
MTIAATPPIRSTFPAGLDRLGWTEVTRPLTAMSVTDDEHDTGAEPSHA